MPAGGFTLYAIWSANSQTITYMPGTGGSGTVAATTGSTDSTVTLSNGSGFTRQWYTISRWDTSSAGNATPYALGQTGVTMPAGGLTLWAVWSGNQYVYNANGGSGSTAAQTFIGNSMSAQTNGFTPPSGYTFGGWCTTQPALGAACSGMQYGGSSSSSLPNPATTTVTLFAIWTGVSQSITYNANSGTGTITATTGNTGATVSLNNGSGFTRSGYTLLRWNTLSGGGGNNYTLGQTGVTMPAGGLSLFAIWSGNTYSYNGNTATAGSTASQTYAGSTLTARPNGFTAPSGYAFSGWCTTQPALGSSCSGSPYAANANLPIPTQSTVTLYAVWLTTTRTVTYARNGATGVLPTEPVKNVGDQFTVAGIGAITKTGYTFAGWTDGTNTYQAGDTYTVGASDITLTAQWTLSVYTVTYSANSGTGNASRSSESYTYGSPAINLPTIGTLARIGYTFGGWSESTTGSAISGAYTPTQTRTLHAVWNPNTYTITYDRNGGSGAAPSAGTYTTAGTSVTLPGVGAMSKVGYNFTGWATSAGGTAIANTGFTTTSNITLYAVWTIKTISVTYNAGSISGIVPTLTNFPANTSGLYGSNITISSTIDTLTNSSNYAFAGWSDGTSIYNKGDTYRLVDAPLTLTAQWIALYAVRYSLGGGTYATGTNNFDSECTLSGVDQKCSNGQTITANISPTRTGYTFAGWVDQSGNAISQATNGWTITATSYLAFATWTPIAYQVLYDSQGGSAAPTESTKNIGDLITVKAAVTRIGYTFLGWSYAGTTYGPGASVQVGSANISFTAQWSAINYTVSYDINGGTSAVPVSVVRNYLNTVTLATAPTRPGYTFTHWSDGANAFAPGDTYTMSAQDVTFTAVWNAINYTMSYNSNGGSAAPSALTGKRIGDSFAIPAAVTRASRNFLGWSDGTNTYSPGQNYVVQTSSVDFAAVWSGELYPIVYSANGGIGSLPTEIDRLAADTFTVGTGSGLSRAGYTFAGWNAGGVLVQPNESFTVGNGPVNLAAIWNKNPLTITFAANDGSGATQSQALDADTPTNLAANTFTRANYTFAGWSTNSDGGGASYTNGQSVNLLTNRTLHAKWNPAFPITFNANGGSEVPALTYTGTALTRPTDPTRTGYTFAGWNQGSSAVSWDYTPLAPATLTAQWSANQYAITFDKNDGSNVTATQSNITADQNTPLTGNGALGFTRANFAFNGWSENADGTGAQFADGANITLLGAKRLFAKWSATNYIVTYNAGINGSSPRASDNFAIGGAGLILPLPTRANFTFDGWYDRNVGGNRIGLAGATYSPTEDKTIHARWIQTSLYGVDQNSLTDLGTISASAVLGTGISADVTRDGIDTRISLTVPAGALPTGTVVSAKLVGDFSRAQNLLANSNNVILSMVVSWLAPDYTVPDTAPNKPLRMVIEHQDIRIGSSIYSILGTSVTLLGRATENGRATFFLRTDPELVIAVTVPDAPTNVLATAGANAQSVITWSAPAIDGGSSITGYRVTSSAGQMCTTTTELTCTVTGLTNGTSYTFTVAAQNSRGYSMESAPSSAITPNTAAPVNIRTGQTDDENSKEQGTESENLTEPVEEIEPVTTVLPDLPITQGEDGVSVIATGRPNTLIDGKRVSENIQVINSIQLVTQSQGIQLQIVSRASDAKALNIPSTTGLILEHDGRAEIAGAGFKEQTTVKIWLFSTPTYLGEFPVDTNGGFNAALTVINTLPVGQHTLQINGITPDNKIFSQSLPVIIQAKTAAKILKKRAKVQLLNIKAVTIGLSATSVTFAFTQIENSAKYRIFVTDVGTGRLVRAVESFKTRVALSRLTAGTSYTLLVIAYNSANKEIAKMNAPGLAFTTLAKNPPRPKISIICAVPGKSIRVTGVKPKCPTGYSADENFAPLGALVSKIGRK